MAFRKTARLQIRAVSERKDANLEHFTKTAQKGGEKELTTLDPRYLYAHVTGLHGDEPNQNGDFFAWPELLRKHFAVDKPVWATWIGCPNLTDHDHKKVVGEIIDAGPINTEKAIDFVVKVDKEKHPQLCENIRSGAIKTLSMGCRVEYSICSDCGNVATTEAEWCDDLSPMAKDLKGKKNPTTGKFVYEDNRDVTGEEVSWITFGEAADPLAVNRQILAKEMKMDSAGIARGLSHQPSERVGTGQGPVAGGGGGLPDYAAQQVKQAIKEERGEVLPIHASASDVLKGIARKMISASEAIGYCVRLALVTPDQAGDLTVNRALALLKRQSGGGRAAPLEDADPTATMASEQKDDPMATNAAQGAAPVARAPRPQAAPAPAKEAQLFDLPMDEGPMGDLGDLDDLPMDELEPDMDMEPLPEGDQEAIADEVDDALSSIEDLEKLEGEEDENGNGEPDPAIQEKEREVIDEVKENLESVEEIVAPPEDEDEKDEAGEAEGEEADEEEEDGEADEEGKASEAKTVKGRIDIGALTDALQGGRFYQSGSFALHKDGSAYSYGELIGQKQADGSYWLNDKKYSVTTSGHQNSLKKAADSAFPGGAPAAPAAPAEAPEAAAAPVPAASPAETEPPVEEAVVKEARSKLFTIQATKTGGAKGAIGWIVRCKDKKIFRVIAGRVFRGKKALAENLKKFSSKAYARSLLHSLRDNGIVATLQAIGGPGAVDYLAPAKDLEKLDGAIVAQAKKVKAQVQVSIPPGQESEDMRVSDEGGEAATQDAPQLPPVSTTLVDMVAPLIAGTDGLTPDQVIQGLTEIFIDPSKRGAFSGALQEKVEQHQSEVAEQGTPAGKEMAEGEGVEQAPPAATPPAAGGGETQAMKKSATLLVTAHKQVQAAEEGKQKAEKIALGWQKRAKRAEDYIKVENRKKILRARAVRGKELAIRMAKIDYIDNTQQSIKNHAVKLAKLDDQAFNSEVARINYLEKRVNSMLAKKAESQHADYIPEELRGADADYVTAEVDGDTGRRTAAVRRTEHADQPIAALPQQGFADGSLATPTGRTNGQAGGTGGVLGNLPWEGTPDI